MRQEKPKRLFVAIALPDEVKQALSSVSDYFQHPSVRWIPIQNLHITAHFVGMTPVKTFPEILRLTSLAASESQPFSLRFSQLKVISRKRKPMMVWAEFEQSDAFTQLGLLLQQTLPGDDSKTPVPHITLARIKERGIVELPALLFVKKFSIPVAQIELWESQLSSSVSVYKRIESFRLG